MGRQSQAKPKVGLCRRPLIQLSQASLMRICAIVLLVRSRQPLATTMPKCKRQSQPWSPGGAYVFKVRKRREAIQVQDLATILEIQCRKPSAHLEQIGESLR